MGSIALPAPCLRMNAFWASDGPSAVRRLRQPRRDVAPSWLRSEVLRQVPLDQNTHVGEGL